VATNIAEGSKRRCSADDARFLNISEGALAETGCLLLLGGDLGYVEKGDVACLLVEVEEIARMLNRLRSKVEAGR
jgi:four helix bundle protein